MQVVAITGVRQAELVELPEPQAKENWVVVKVHATPMCTEYKAWQAGAPTPEPGPRSRGRGGRGRPAGQAQGGRPRGRHAASMPAALRAVRQRRFHPLPERHERGELYRLARWAGHLQPVPAQARLDAPRIPDGVSYELAGLALCAMGPSFGAMDRMGVTALGHDPDHRHGPRGPGRIVNAAYRGARVIAMEASPTACRYARRLGAEVVLDPTRPAGAGGGDGPDRRPGRGQGARLLGHRRAPSAFASTRCAGAAR